jgi:lipopolysaccharide transport system ATP-binding protein
MSDFAVRAVGLSKRYRLGQVETVFTRARRRLRGESGPGHIWAIKDLSFEIGEGDAVAIIGRNGAGKSTLLKVLSRVTEPTEGYVDVAGRVGALLEVGTGFSGELTGRENVYLNGSILGMSRVEINRKLEEIVEFSGVKRHFDTPVKWYSSGMYVRLAFAVAAHLEPHILIVDEVLAVGDTEFQKKCLTRMSEVAKEGRTLLFVSHNAQLVRRLCRRAILLDQGSMVAEGAAEDVVRTYLASIETEDAGLRRWQDASIGDRDCRVVEIRVTDESGVPATTLFTSKPIYITVEFDIPDVNPMLNPRIELTTMDGVIVLDSTYRHLADEALPRLVPGRNALRCEIPPGLLNSGRYLVNLRFSLHNRRWLIHEDAVLHFDVVADHGDSLFMVAGGRSGVVAPVLSWSAVDPTSPVEERAALHVAG